MLSEHEAKQIKSIPEWDTLEQHFRDAIRALDCVTEIDETEDHEKVARGKKYAVRCIEAILEPFNIEDLTEEDARGEAMEKLGLVDKKRDSEK